MYFVRPYLTTIDEALSTMEKCLNYVDLIPLKPVSQFSGTAREYFGYFEIVAGIVSASLNFFAASFISLCLKPSNENFARKNRLYKQAKVDLTSYTANGLANVMRGYYVKANMPNAWALTASKLALMAYDFMGYRVNYKYEPSFSGYKCLLRDLQWR